MTPLHYALAVLFAALLARTPSTLAKNQNKKTNELAEQNKKLLEKRKRILLETDDAIDSDTGFVTENTSYFDKKSNEIEKSSFFASLISPAYQARTKIENVSGLLTLLASQYGVPVKHLALMNAAIIATHVIFPDEGEDTVDILSRAAESIAQIAAGKTAGTVIKKGP